MDVYLLGHSNKIHCFTGNPARNIGSICIFFIINYCHHVIAIETTCASRTSLIATLSFEAASKMVNNVTDLGRIEYTLKGPFAGGAIKHLNSASSWGFPTKCPRVRCSNGSPVRLCSTRRVSFTTFSPIQT